VEKSVNRANLAAGAFRLRKEDCQPRFCYERSADVIWDRNRGSLTMETTCRSMRHSLTGVGSIAQFHSPTESPSSFENQGMDPH
jgi:hypothetical protein